MSTAAREQASRRAGFKQTLANRVSIDKDGTIRIAYHPSNQVPRQRLYEQLKSMLGRVGAVNPSLTAMANALRVGDHLLERMAPSPAVT